MGLVLDAGIEEDLRIRHLQVADATRASLGLPVVEYVVTDTPLEVPIYFIDKRYLSVELDLRIGKTKNKKFQAISCYSFAL